MNISTIPQSRGILSQRQGHPSRGKVLFGELQEYWLWVTPTFITYITSSITQNLVSTKRRV